MSLYNNNSLILRLMPTSTSTINIIIMMLCSWT